MENISTKRKRGLPKGRTNNPYGRPKGSKNKTSGLLEKMFVKLARKQSKEFKKALTVLEENPNSYTRKYLDILKLYME